MSPKKKGVLFLVGTPIGNLDDITARAVETLRRVDVIACEDTRRTRKLLSHYKINKKRLLRCDQHITYAVGRELVELFNQGINIAYVSDAGMPAISDPGTALVRLCTDNGIDVVPVPGPNAAVTALAISGFSSSSFIFEGYLPRKPQERLARIQRLKSMEMPIVVYASPHRIKRILAEIAAETPDREVVICREMTKINEDILRGTSEEVNLELDEDRTRGEFVLVVDRAPESEENRFKMDNIPNDRIERALRVCIQNFEMSSNEAAKVVSALLGIPKQEIYHLASMIPKQRPPR
ncbi:MAG: 16S rRNA (cytidine(1402)-2'-O)-methyltransferase [Candidatus Coatesbacteria bacterium]|nr:16S rRNA (cytidine(1402)-2'-O)-methyltransferase [Candidatus Coatesbacteria bacterium]